MVNFGYTSLNGEWKIERWKGEWGSDCFTLKREGGINKLLITREFESGI